MTGRPTGQPGVGLLRVAVLSIEETSRAVDTGDASGVQFLEPALRLAGEFVDYRGSIVGYDQLVARYLSRMGYRATPFGLFAGVAPVRIGRERRLMLSPRAQQRVRLRVDTGALELITEAARDRHPTSVPWVVNPTVRRTGGTLRYSHPGNAQAPIVELRETPAIAAVLRICAQAPTSADGVARALAVGPAQETVRDFVLTLADRHLLLADTALLFHGEEPADLAMSSLATMGAEEEAAALAGLLAGIEAGRGLEEMAAFDFDGPWCRAAAAVPALADVPVPHRYHADLELRAPEATLDRASASALQLAVERLVELFPPDDALASFKEAFRLRYEDARAPLLEALDPDRGVLPPASRRTSNLAEAAEYAGQEVGGGRVEVHQALIQALALGHGGWTVDLLDTPTGQSRAIAQRYPVRVAHAVLLDDYEGRYSAHLLAGYRYGSLGALSRFALAAPELRSDAGAPAGKDTDPLLAELLFGPEGRYGNIVVRPRIHHHAVSLFGARAGTLRPADLDVSVTSGDDVLLWHRPTGRQVLIELNTAHNITAYHNSPLYTFLARARDWGTVMWSWGPLGRVPVLPRVTCGPVILSPRRWLVERTRLRDVLADPQPARRLRQALPGFEDRRWIGFGRDDNILTVDTYSDRSVTALVSRTLGKSATAFVEMPQVEAPPVRSDRGRHCAEVMLPLRVRRERPHPAVVPPAFDRRAGSSWVYVRFHCGLATTDRVLASTADVVAQLRAARPGLRWFFVRYHDGVDHLRVRVDPGDPAARVEVLAALDRLGARLVEEGLAHRTVFDTYVPEPGRYGGHAALAVAESLFAADSDEVAAWVRGRPSETERIDRGVLDALAWTERLTGDLDGQHQLLSSWRSSMGLRPTKRTGQVARDRGLVAVLAPELRPAVAECLDAYRGALAELEERSRWYALGSVMHMHFNRLFETDGRRLEWLSYDLAARHVRRQRAAVAPDPLTVGGRRD